MNLKASRHPPIVASVALGVVSVAALPGCIGGFGGPGLSALNGLGTGAVSSTSQLASAPTLPSGVTLVQLVVETDKLVISQPGYAQQMQVAGVFDDGRVRDMSRLVRWTVANPTIVALGGGNAIAPMGVGTTAMECDYSGMKATGAVTVMASAFVQQTTTTTTTTATTAPTWHLDIFPLFQSTLRCKSCHTASGPGRMKLTLNEQTDYNNMTTSGLLDMTTPANSLLIQKGCGLTSHGGSAAMSATGPEATAIEAWIGAGVPYGSGNVPPPTLGAPDTLIVNPPVRNLVDTNAQQQVVVLGYWKANGLVVDATRAAQFTFSDPSVASVDQNGVIYRTGGGAVTVTVSWQGVTRTLLLDFEPQANLVGGDAPSVIQVPAAGSLLGTTPPPPGTGTATPTSGTLCYDNPVAQLLQPCLGCHNGSTQKDLRTYQAVLAEVIPGNAAGSILVTKLQTNMGQYLANPADTQTIVAWINQGAIQSAPGSAPPPPIPPAQQTYTNTVSTVLMPCTACHDGRTQESLKTYTAVMKFVVPGKPGSSTLYQRVNDTMKNYLADPTNDIEKIRNWIAIGAPQ